MSEQKTGTNELDELDLLEGAERAAPKQASLSTTAQAFDTIIKRKLQQQELELGQAEQQSKARHLLLINTLMSIRKSLRDVLRIELGERFRFELIADDWAGWPRLTVLLKDSLLEGADYPKLRVSAHDRQNRAVIEIEYDPHKAAETLSLASETEANRLSSVLKKCVRSFLDLTGDIVLEAEKQSEAVKAEQSLKSRELCEEESNKKSASKELESDIFSDDYSDELNLESLPSLDEVDILTTKD